MKETGYTGGGDKRRPPKVIKKKWLRRPKGEAPGGSEVMGFQTCSTKGVWSSVLHAALEVTSMKVETNRLVKLKVMGSPGKGEVCDACAQSNWNGAE